MSAIDDKTRLQHILDASQKIQTFIVGHSRDSFEKDELLQLALVRLIEIIGEAASKLSQEFRDEHSNIAWQAIVGMRNRLVHAYFAIDYEIVWNTVSIAIPELVKQIEAIQTKDD